MICIIILNEKWKEALLFFFLIEGTMCVEISRKGVLMGYEARKSKKSTKYCHSEFPHYEIKISYGLYAYNNNAIEPGIEEILILKITNKKTMKSSQQRCFQDEDEILTQIENDFKLKSNRQFERVWKAID